MGTYSQVPGKKNIELRKLSYIDILFMGTTFMNTEEKIGRQEKSAAYFQSILGVKYDQSHYDIISGYADDSLDLEVPNVKLFTHGEQLYGESFGRLQMHNGRFALVIEKDTVDPMGIFQRMTGGRPHAYPTDEQKFSAKGKLANGIDFVTDPMYMASAGIGTPQIFNVNRIEFASPGIQPYSRLTLISKGDNFLPHTDIGEMRAKQFYAKIPDTYCKLDLRDGEFDLCFNKKGRFIRTIEEQSSEYKQNKVEDALLLAMSFVYGRKIHRQATYETGSCHKTVLLHKYPESGYTFFPPVSLDLTGKAGMSVLKAIQEYFTDNINQNIENIMEVFLLPPKYLEVGVRSLVVCVLIEGLVMNLLTTKPKDTFKEPRDRAVAFFESVSLKFKILRRIAKIPAPFQNRLATIMRNAKSLSLSEALATVARDLNFTIEANEKVFFKIRPRLAHGHFPKIYHDTIEEDQLQLDHMRYVTNLFNKLILRAAGYTGSYSDYSVDEYITGAM